MIGFTIDRSDLNEAQRTLGAIVGLSLFATTLFLAAYLWSVS